MHTEYTKLPNDKIWILFSSILLEIAFLRPIRRRLRKFHRTKIWCTFSLGIFFSASNWRRWLHWIEGVCRASDFLGTHKTCHQREGRGWEENVSEGKSIQRDWSWKKYIANLTFLNSLRIRKSSARFFRAMKNKGRLWSLFFSYFLNEESDKLVRQFYAKSQLLMHVVFWESFQWWVIQ